MADVPFVSALGQSLVLQLGAAHAQIPLLDGSRAGRGRGAASLLLAQGNAANAYSVNYVTGRKTTAYAFRTFGNGGSAGILRAAFLNPFLMTRDSNGNLAMCDTKFSQLVYSLASDQCKAYSLAIDINAAADAPVMVSGSLIGMGVVSAATFDSVTAQTGVAMESRKVAFACDAGTATTAATEIERCAITLVPGGKYGAWADNIDTPSNIDPGVLSGAVVIRQRSGATNRVDALDHAQLKVTFPGSGGLVATFELERSGDGVTTDFGNGLSVETTFFLQGLTGAPATFA